MTVASPSPWKPSSRADEYCGELDPRPRGRSRLDDVSLRGVVLVRVVAFG